MPAKRVIIYVSDLIRRLIIFLRFRNDGCKKILRFVFFLLLKYRWCLLRFRCFFFIKASRNVVSLFRLLILKINMFRVFVKIMVFIAIILITRLMYYTFHHKQTTYFSF